MARSRLRSGPYGTLFIARNSVLNQKAKKWSALYRGTPIRPPHSSCAREDDARHTLPLPQRATPAPRRRAPAEDPPESRAQNCALVLAVPANAHAPQIREQEGPQDALPVAVRRPAPTVKPLLDCPLPFRAKGAPDAETHRLALVLVPPEGRKPAIAERRRRRRQRWAWERFGRKRRRQTWNQTHRKREERTLQHLATESP
jgi:hypothetical protein